MPKRPIGSSQGGKGPMKKYRRVAAKRMNYVPLRWIAKQNRPFRATIPINPFPPVYRTKVTWAPPATTWTPGSGNAVIQFKLNSVFDCELSSVFSATQQPLFFDTICTSTGPYKQFKVLGWRGKIHMVNLGGQSDDTPSTSLRDIYEVLYQQGYELSAEGDTNAELQAAPNLQRHLLPGIVNGSASEKSIYFQGQSKDFFATGTDDSTLVGNYLGDPAVIVYGSLGVRSLNSKNIFMAFQVTIEYDVEFLVMTGCFINTSIIFLK